MGRGKRKRTPIRLTPVSDLETESPQYIADLYAFADVIERIAELTINESEPFALDHRIGVPALDMLHHAHGEISLAHAKLLRECVKRELVHEGVTDQAVPVRVVDLTASRPHLSALITSIVCLSQATNKSNPLAAIPSSLRDGLVGEGLADAYFAHAGWEPVVGIGAFHREEASTYGARLIHGQGLDHLFRRQRAGGQTEFLVAETKMHKADGPLDGFLLRQFAQTQLNEAGSESYGTPALSPAWSAERLHRAFVRGALDPTDYRDVTAALGAGQLRRAVVVIACSDYDTPTRIHAPDPDRLWFETTDGKMPLADEVVTLRVPKAALTTLVNDIGSARARSIAAIASDPNSEGAVRWRERSG